MNKTIDKDILTQHIVAAIQDLKGEDILIFDLTKIENAVAETFVICSGNSNTHVSALAGSVEKKLRNELGERPWHVEGSGNALWVLVDYIHVVVHIFQKEIREYYNLEELWGDAQITAV